MSARRVLAGIYAVDPFRIMVQPCGGWRVRAPGKLPAELAPLYARKVDAVDAVERYLDALDEEPGTATPRPNRRTKTGELGIARGGRS